MNNDNKPNIAKVVTPLAILALIIGGLGYYFNSQSTVTKPSVTSSSSSSSSNSSSMASKTDINTIPAESSSASSMVSGDMNMAKVGVYKPYAATELASAKDGHKVVLFFNATWCPTCQATTKDIGMNVTAIDPKLHILSVDYDTNVELRQKYGVTMQHTFVSVNSDGSIIKKASGLDTLSSITNFAFDRQS